MIWGASTLVVLAMFVFAAQAWRGVSALRDAGNIAQRLSDRVVAGDVPGARYELAAFDRATTTARESTDGPLWWLGSKIPYVGRNVGALRTVASASDSVADYALPGIVDVADQVQIDAFRPRNGRVDLKAVSRTVPVLDRADQTLSAADARIASIDPNSLLPLLRAPMADVRVKAHGAAAAAATAHEAALLMPAMLGADGRTRHYLLLITNNAEVRSLGGMPGSLAVLTARNGKLKMGRQGGILDALPLDKPITPIRGEVAGGFQSAVATDVRDTTIVPEFPRAARLAAGIVGERWDQHFDGVAAIDPVALGYLLGGLGPVDIGDGIELNQSNAATVLLNGVYLKYPNAPDRQDDTFERAARKSFDALVDGTGDSVRTVRALVRGVQERRVMLWSRSTEEQQRIGRTGVSGSLAPSPLAEVGFFVNDAAESKMEYYLRTSSRLETQGCRPNGSQVVRLTADLRSEAPQGGKLPQSVTGLGQYTKSGEMRFHALLMSPPGGRINAVSVDGIRAPVGATFYEGRQVVRFPRILRAGESTVVTIDLTTAPHTLGAPFLRTTPGIVPNEDVISTRACD